jgi:phosphate uptake regulator
MDKLKSSVNVKSSVDIRRVQITGGSSFMVTLPKDWAESVGMKKNDSVGLQAQPDGSIIIYPQGIEKTVEKTVKVIDVDSVKDRDFLYRQLVGSYIAGHSSIELRSESHIPSMVAGVASVFTQTAIGLEIIDESDTRILIKDLMDQAEMKPVKSIERLKVLIKNLLSDILDGAESGRKNIAENLVEKDREIDRIDWLISRQVNIYQKDYSLARKLGTKLTEISGCSTASRTLERIGDHGLILAKNIDVLNEEPGTAEVLKEVVSIGREVMEQVSISVSTWLDKDMHAANKCIEDSARLAERTRILSRMASDLNQNVGVAVSIIGGSLRRMAEYSMDLSELAINSAMG